MKAFYIIHALIVIEIVLAIIFIVKLQELAARVRGLNREMKFNSKFILQKIKKYHQRLEKFNNEYQKKVINNLDFLKKLIFALSIHCSKLLLPKTSILSKILNYKATIIGFLTSLLLFRKKNARKPVESDII